jgi:hypothetical protein
MRFPYGQIVRVVLTFSLAMACISLALNYQASAAPRPQQSCQQECSADEHSEIQACTADRTACIAACGGNTSCRQQCSADYITCKEDAYDDFVTCSEGCCTGNQCG